ncbi:MAG: T9SS type A sorting domain-containing protein [Bacteroidetes bacterium]|nr:T9SS type A sorting domain-containing protein [Bacteroidota bacterium]
MKKILLFSALAVCANTFAQMTMTSSAMLGSCNCYQLTTATTADKGAIWSPVAIDLNNAFDMTFNIYAGTDDVWGGDGMVFVLQQNPSGIGDAANALGYKDVAPLSVPPISTKSLGIEIDTYDNAPSVATDIASDHMGLNSNGSNAHNLGGPYAIPNVEDGLYHEFRVVWSPTLQTMTVTLDGAFIFLYTNDIITNIFTGNPMVYFGFTGATGGSVNEYRVCMYRNAAFTTDLTSVCPDLPVAFTDNSTSDLNNILDYTWDFGDGSPLDANQNSSHVYTTPGTYTAKLLMTDVSGCTDSAQINITVLPDLIVNVAGTDATCFGDTDGAATATPQNGTGPYLYTWDDVLAQTTQTATGLVPNSTYNVNVVDDLGCTGTGTVTINEPLEIFVDIQGTNAMCFGSNDGTGTAVVTNGIAPLTYLWSDAAGQTSDVATGLGAGTYSVVVTDDNGCTGTDTFDVAEPTEIIITGSVSYDNGTGNGAIDATVAGGTTPYASTVWSNSATTEDINGLGSGSYTLTVTDAQGCIKDTTFYVKSSVGLDDMGIAGFEIYPNPSNGTFQIKGKGFYTFVVTDVAGKLVLTDNATNNHTVNLGNVERGVYFIRIEKEGTRYTERIVVQ